MQKQQCNVVQEQQCQEKWRDETQNYSETQCSTQYKEDCEYQWEGTGNNKVWAPIPGTCNSNPYDHCEDVQKQAVKQVPYTDCQAVPKQVKYFIHSFFIYQNIFFVTVAVTRNTSLVAYKNSVLADDEYIELFLDCSGLQQRAEPGMQLGDEAGLPPGFLHGLPAGAPAAVPHCPQEGAKTGQQTGKKCK